MFRGLQQLGLGLAMVLLAVATTRGEENLRDTEAGRQVLQTLKGLAQGNEHDAGIDTLTLDIGSGRVHGKVWVRHRQSWGTLRVWIPWPLPSHWEGRESVAYDLRQEAEFSYDGARNSGHITLDLGRGVRLDTTDIGRILDGKVLEVLAEKCSNPDLVTSEFGDDYNQIVASYQKDYGPDNIYFASRPFVDWATPETAGRWLITAHLTGEKAALAQALVEVRHKALEEAGSFAAWLRSKGVQEAERAAQQILSGEQLDWPSLAETSQTVGYYSQRTVAGRWKTPLIRVTHGAFAIIWQGGGTTGLGSTNPPGSSTNPPVGDNGVVVDPLDGGSPSTMLDPNRAHAACIINKTGDQISVDIYHRIECIQYHSPLLNDGARVTTYPRRGEGLPEGERVVLGWRQRDGSLVSLGRIRIDGPKTISVHLGGISDLTSIMPPYSVPSLAPSPTPGDSRALIVNETRREAVVRIYHKDPQIHFSRWMRPGEEFLIDAQTTGTLLRGGERAVAAWDANTGEILALGKIGVHGDIRIGVHKMW